MHPLAPSQGTTLSCSKVTFLNVQPLTIQLQLYFIEQLGVKRRFWSFNELLDVSLELLEAVDRYFLHCSSSSPATNQYSQQAGNRPSVSISLHSGSFIAQDSCLQDGRDQKKQSPTCELEVEGPPRPGDALGTTGTYSCNISIRGHV